MLTKFYSPYINRFLQPDSIIPDQTNPQSRNRYSYVENDPINYSDVFGHFKCKNQSRTFDEGDCQVAAEALLDLLQEKGGEEGQMLVKAFREADNTTVCNRFGKCRDLKDQITIIVKDEIAPGVRARYEETLFGNKRYLLTAGVLTSSGDGQLAMAGAFGHEIFHQIQERAQLQTLIAELTAYDIQWRLYQNFGIDDYAGEPCCDVAVAEEVASYVDDTEEEIVESNWANSNYPTLPFTNDAMPISHP